MAYIVLVRIWKFKICQYGLIKRNMVIAVVMSIREVLIYRCLLIDWRNYCSIKFVLFLSSMVLTFHSLSKKF